MTALLVAAGLGSVAAPDDPRRMVLGPLLALLVGGIQLLLRVSRMAALVNFISGSVLAGFISAATLTIAAAQVKDLLGVGGGGGLSLVEVLRDLVPRLGQIHAATAAIGATSLAAVVLGRRFAPQLPMPLLVTLAGISLSAWLGLDQLGVHTLGAVPAGLPAPALPFLDSTQVFALLPYAGAIALLSFMEATAQARAVTRRTREMVEPSGELVALGCMNVAAAFFGGFPAGVSYSRTALNLQAGARTQLAGLVAAVVVLITVQTLTPFLSPLPKAVLAAVVVVAVLSLVDVSALPHTWRIRHEDGLAAAVTFLVTLILGIGGGIAAGVLFSLAAFVYRSANPRLVELGRVEGTTLYRNIERFSVHTDPSVLLLRMDGPLYFANAKFLADHVLALVAGRRAVKHVLLDSSGMPDVDADGARTLADLDLQIRAIGATLHLVTVRGPVRDVLQRAGLSEALLGEERYSTTLEEAVAALDLPGGSPLRTRGASERRPTRVF
jgi:SulP family sulfate permease